MCEVNLRASCPAGLVRLELPGGAVELGPGEVEVRVTARTGFAVSREGAAAVALDLDLDDDLRKRGLCAT